jgi:hypothetical protein
MTVYYKSNLSMWGVSAWVKNNYKKKYFRTPVILEECFRRFRQNKRPLFPTKSFKNQLKIVHGQPCTLKSTKIFQKYLTVEYRRTGLSFQRVNVLFTTFILKKYNVYKTVWHRWNGWVMANQYLLVERANNV